MSGHQPKELTELAFTSFTAYMKDQALQLRNWTEVSPTSTDVATKTCRELKDFFHGTRLPPVLANEITKRLLRMLNIFSGINGTTRMDYFQQILITLVEVSMHSNVTSLELSPSYLYDILKIILMKVGHLHNLKTLSVGHGINYLKHVKLVLPSQLKELTLYGSLFLDNDNLKRIVKCCRELKFLKIVRCHYANISVPDILKLNRLETLHLFGESICGLDAACMAVINGISTDVSSDVLSSSTLKSFGLTISQETSLRLIVDKLPHLTEIVLQLPFEVDLSCLTQLKNLRSLTLDVGDRASDDYKKILPALGKSLVSLDLRCYETLDLEFIGETCSNLQCLHVKTTECFPVTHPKPSLKTFPNFRTIECLKVSMTWDADWVEFVIVQCVNIKLLSVIFGRRPSIIRNILKRTSLTSLEEIHWYPEVILENTCLEELCLKCPNLRLVHGLGSDSFISGRVVFQLYGCPNSLCKIYCYSLNVIDSVDW